MIIVRCLKLNSIRNNVRRFCSRILVNNISSDYVLNSGEPDVDIPSCTLPEFLAPYQIKYENKVAIECAVTKKRYTYADIRDKSTSLSKSLRQILKLKDGDVVAIVLRNIPEFPIVSLGILKANLIITPVSAVFTPGEISSQLSQSGAKVVITEVELYDRVNLALQITKTRMPTLVIKTQNSQFIPEGTINFLEFINASCDSTEISPCNPDDVALMPYSSGTTGLPKGVELTHRNLVAKTVLANAFEQEYQTDATDSYQEVAFSIPPFYHVYGQTPIINYNIIGGKVIAMPNYSQEAFMSVLENHKSTILYLVPSLVLMLLSNNAVKKDHLRDVRVIMTGGSVMAASEEQALLNKFGEDLIFLQGYGMTETTGLATAVRPSIMTNTNSFRGSIGRPVRNTEIKIVNPDDPKNTPLGPDTTGEILIKGPLIMKGYHNMPEETSKIMCEDGWMRSGDVGHYNKDGFMFITDRLKELIKVKGNQVAPAELEGVIRSFPGVIDAAVVGVPHEISGEVPRAYIVAKHGIDLTELNEFVNNNVARYKQLRGGIVVVEALPKTPTGKNSRTKLKEMAYQQYNQK